VAREREREREEEVIKDEQRQDHNSFQRVLAAARFNK
jgi:hypothetical protein